MSNQFDTLIFDAATRYGVDPALIKAVMKAESNFDPNGLSPGAFRVGCSRRKSWGGVLLMVLLMMGGR